MKTLTKEEIQAKADNYVNEYDFTGSPSEIANEAYKDGYTQALTDMQQPVDVESIRGLFFQRLYQNHFECKPENPDVLYEYEVKKFFDEIVLPHLQPAQSDAVEFLDWYIEHDREIGMTDGKYTWTEYNGKSKVIGSRRELYQEFLNQKTQPHE